MSKAATTPEEAKAQAEKAEQDLIIANSDMIAVLDTPQGVRVLRRILQDTGLMRSSFVGNRNNYTFFLEGCRNIGLQLIERIGAAAPHRVAELVVNLAEVERVRKEREKTND